MIGASAAIPLLACWLLSALRDTVPNTTTAITLVLPVVAAAATGIRPAGMVAALAAAAGFDYFLTEPLHQFRIADPADLQTAVLLLVVGAAVSELANWGRRQQARASREQAASIDEVNSAVRTLDQMTQHNASLVEETNAVIEQTEGQTQRLDEIVDIFHLEERASKATAPRLVA